MIFFTPDTTRFENYIDKGKYTLIWRLSLLFMFFFAALGVSALFYDSTASLIDWVVFCVASLGFIYLNKTKKYKPIFWVYSVFAAIIVSFSLNASLQTIHYSEMIWIVSVIIFSFIGLGRKVGLLFMLAMLSMLFVHVYLVLNNQIESMRAHTFSELAGLCVELGFGVFSVSYLIHQYLLFQSYSESQLILANRELEYQNRLIHRKNQENLTLIKEVHHRVKNNLQIIVSLLRMQKEEVKSIESKAHFDEAINRILAMSLIHQKLYQEKELSNIEVAAYLDELIRDILRSTLGYDQQIDARIEVGIDRLDLQSIVPLGLILNELVMNSLKHAFNISKQGLISVSFEPFNEGNGVLLTYSDNGAWIEGTTDEKGFGLELIYLLTEQMGGSIQRNGSTFRFQIEQL
jgi:two-component sensor histidine kinase